MNSFAVTVWTFIRQAISIVTTISFVGILVFLMFRDAAQKRGKSFSFSNPFAWRSGATTKRDRATTTDAATPVSFSSGANNAGDLDCEVIRRCLGMQPATCPSNLKAPEHALAGESNNKPLDGSRDGQTPVPFARFPLAKNPDWLEAARRKGTIPRPTPAMATPFLKPGQERNLSGPNSFQDSPHGTPEKNPVIGISRNKSTDDTSSFPSPPMSPWGQNSQPNVPAEATDDIEDRSGGREAATAPSGVLDALVNSRSSRCQN